MKNILQAIKSCLNGLRVYVDKVVEKATAALATKEDTKKIKGLAETAQTTAENAQATADNAKGTAGNAVSLANNAQATAETAAKGTRSYFTTDSFFSMTERMEVGERIKVNVYQSTLDLFSECRTGDSICGFCGIYNNSVLIHLYKRDDDGRITSNVVAVINDIPYTFCVIGRINELYVYRLS